MEENFLPKVRIPQDSLKSRVIWRSELDQRYYLMQEIEKAKIMDPKPLNNWTFIPEKWVKAAAKEIEKSYLENSAPSIKNRSSVQRKQYECHEILLVYIL